MVQRDVRAHVKQVLGWDAAHVTWDRAVRGIPPRWRGVTPQGLPHSPWQLVEHMRRAQADILEFCRSRSYRDKEWPADYWPPSSAPRRPGQWAASLDAYRADRRALVALASRADIDLAARISHGTGQTYLRELLLVADHTAYHVGQLVLVRKALGLWS